jgi:hypothetical protein
VSSLKWGITAGIAAAIISIGLGVISGVTTGYILIRAVIFLIVFFALGIGVRVLINNYFPELLYFEDESSPSMTFDQPGSQVNITLGGTGDYAVPEMYKDSGDSQELGNIEELISGNFKVRPIFEPTAVDTSQAHASEHDSEGIDLRSDHDYNIQGESLSAAPHEFASFQGTETPKPITFEKPVFTPIFGGDSDDLETLPDLGSMATVFSTGFEADEATAMPHLGEEAESAGTQYNKGNKPQPLKGDFNPKELAQGLRTVLSKDKR